MNHTIHYSIEQVQRAANAMGPMPHLEVLKKYLPEMLEAEINHSFGAGAPASNRFHACAFNMETGSRLEGIKLYLQRHPKLRGMDIILASELDNGMLRSGNLNVTRELASALKMNYAYGVEFITGTAGKNGNGLGMHGNAILSRFPLTHVSVVHLPIAYEWFNKPNDARLGMRNAVAAEIRFPGGPLVVCSVHLENRATPAARDRQLRYLLDKIDQEYGKDARVLMAGDLNTNTVDGDDDLHAWLPLEHHPEEQAYRMSHIGDYEPLLRTAVEYGYSYETSNLPGKTTRRKPMNDGSEIHLNLDWFLCRRLTGSQPARIQAIFDHCELDGGDAYVHLDGRVLSDHDLLTLTCELGAQAALA